MQGLLFVVILEVILIALPLLVLSDTDTPTVDVAIPGDEVTGNGSRANNSSASATITMYTGDAE